MVLFLSVDFFLPYLGEIIVKMQHTEYQGDILFHQPPFFSTSLYFSFSDVCFFISCPVLICHIVAIKH